MGSGGGNFESRRSCYCKFRRAHAAPLRPLGIPNRMQPTIDSLARTLPERLADGTGVVARSNQGTVHRVAHAGRIFAVKCAAGRGPLGAVNRLALRREYRAYRRLDGISGVPRCHAFIDDRWLVLDFIEGVPFRHAAAGPSFFVHLLATLRSMHERGVAHGDLKRKANLMVDARGRPMLIDFGAAVIRRPGFHPVNRRLFEFMRQTDLNAWVKLKYGGYENVDDDDRALLARSWIERSLGRFRR
mgnify:CR=1 FL=1